jgi:hypothetical protein
VTLSLFSFQPFSLLCKLLLPAQLQLQQPSSPSTPPPTSCQPPRPAAPPTCVRWTPPTSVPFLPLFSWPLHAEDILHAMAE